MYISTCPYFGGFPPPRFFSPQYPNQPNWIKKSSWGYSSRSHFFLPFRGPRRDGPLPPWVVQGRCDVRAQATVTGSDPRGALLTSTTVVGGGWSRRCKMTSPEGITGLGLQPTRGGKCRGVKVSIGLFDWSWILFFYANYTSGIVMPSPTAGRPNLADQKTIWLLQDWPLRP